MRAPLENLIGQGHSPAAQLITLNSSRGWFLLLVVKPLCVRRGYYNLKKKRRERADYRRGPNDKQAAASGSSLFCTTEPRNPNLLHSNWSRLVPISDARFVFAGRRGLPGGTWRANVHGGGGDDAIARDPATWACLRFRIFSFHFFPLR